MKSTAQRELIWDHSIQLIKQHPIFGVGLGDGNDELQAQYLEIGEMDMAYKKLNAHNQFFQTTIQLGLLGLLSLISIVVYPLLNPRNKSVFFITFLTVIIVILNFLTESMLERQAGVIFLAFVSSLLIQLSKQEKDQQ